MLLLYTPLYAVIISNIFQPTCCLFLFRIRTNHFWYICGPLFYSMFLQVNTYVKISFVDPYSAPYVSINVLGRSINIVKELPDTSSINNVIHLTDQSKLVLSSLMFISILSLFSYVSWRTPEFNTMAVHTISNIYFVVSYQCTLTTCILLLNVRLIGFYTLPLPFCSQSFLIS